MPVLVAGASVAGLTAALALARQGHDVVLCDADTVDADGAWPTAFDRERSVAQFHHPHAFLAYARNLLLARAPDVRDDLLRAGAHEIDMSATLPPDHRDDDLVALVARRPIIEWALIRAVRSEPRVAVRDGCRLGGLVVTRTDRPTVGGLRTQDGDVVRGDLVVDAMGRRSPVARWLRDEGLPVPIERSSSCGRLYYGRYFRFLPGAEQPTRYAPIQSVRDLGYLSHAVFWEDNDVFGISLAPLPWERSLRVLGDPGAWMAAARAMPALRSLLDPDRSEPISPILSMGGLRNVLRRSTTEGRRVLGLVTVGDAMCHTNPAFAFGMSLAMSHAFALADVLSTADDLDDVAMAYEHAVHPTTSAWHEMVASTDDARIRFERGEPIDPTTPDGDLRLFITRVVPRAMLADPELYARYVRRANLLDPPSVLEEDEDLLWRAAEIHARQAADPTGGAPGREELLRIAEAGVGSGGAGQP